MFNRNIHRRKLQRGFTLAEVALAMIVFLMMTLMFAAVFPIAIRASHYSNNNAQAALLAQHKIDQLRSAGIGNLNYASLQHLGVVDQSTTETGPTYSFATADNLNSFFPSPATGQISIVDYSTISEVSPAPPAGTVYVATITISWPETGSIYGSYSTSAMIVSMVHQ
jgi:type II secretory pathway pseudopilin PulG